MRGLGSLGEGCGSTISNELLMVAHMEAPLRCSFWLERQTTLHSKNRLGILREAANTNPERMETSSSKFGCVGEGNTGKRLRRSSYKQLTMVSVRPNRITTRTNKNRGRFRRPRVT